MSERKCRFLLSLPISRAGNTHRCVGIQAQQAFEEGMATVDDARVAQHLLVDHRERLALLHHRRQLFLVADEDEALNGISLTMAGTEYPHEMGVENLRCLIDDGERERHALKEFTIVKHRCRGGDIHPCRCKHLPHLYQRVTMTRLLPHEVFPVFFGTRGTASDTDEVDVMLHEFRTNLVHRPVGIRKQDDRPGLPYELFLEDVHQSERSLPGSRRSDKQHIVERAHELLHQWLERAIITKGFFSEVDPRQPQPEQQSAPVWPRS